MLFLRNIIGPLRTNPRRDGRAGKDATDLAIGATNGAMRH